MKKREMQVLDYLLELLSIAGVILYLILQMIYVSMYTVEGTTIFYHIVTLILIYAATMVLQIFPDLLNVGAVEPLQGKIRHYAIRMVRWMKFLLIYAILIPSVFDVAGVEINAAFSLIICALIIFDLFYYFYKIWRYNRSQGHK